MVNKKAQLKIQQMAFMLIAVTLFFVLVGLFILVIYMSGLKDGAESLNEKNAALLAAKLSNSPEFSCGNSFGGTKLNCIDGDKVMVLKENINDYGIANKNFWGVQNIEIRKIYPSEYGDTECNRGNYNNCGVLKIFDEEMIGTIYSNYVLLCKKALSEDGHPRDKCEMAMFMISAKELEE